MAGERYSEKAVKALYDRIVATFTTQLRAVETAVGLTSGALTDPAAYVRARVPNDNRSPIVQVYEESWRFDGPDRNCLLAVDCTVLIDFAGSVDLEASELQMRRYITALLQVIESDRALNDSLVSGVYILDGEGSRSIGDKSATRMIWAQGFLVKVHTP